MNRSFLLAGSILLAAALAPIAAQADSPHDFLTKALKGDNSEIMLGNLAADRGRSQGVRDFGRTLVSDHTQARNEVLDVGRRFGVRPTREMAPGAREERDRLASLRGREFDRQFIRLMIDDHHKDINEFRDEAREHHGAVSALAERQLPTLRAHLRTAMSLDNGNGRFSGRFDQAHDWQDRGSDRGSYDRGNSDRGNYDRGNYDRGGYNR